MRDNIQNNWPVPFKKCQGQGTEEKAELLQIKGQQRGRQLNAMYDRGLDLDWEKMKVRKLFDEIQVFTNVQSSDYSNCIMCPY